MGRRRYTEEQFRSAVADPTVTTIAELCRRLDLVPRGGNYASLRAFGHQLGIDVDGALGQRVRQVRRTSGKRPWTPDDLAGAISRHGIQDMHDLCLALGVTPRTKAYRRIERVAAEHGLDISAIAPPPRERRPLVLGVSSAELRRLVDTAETRDDILHALDIEVTPNTRRRLTRALAHLGIDARSLAPSPPLTPRVPTPWNRRPLDDLLRADTDVTSSSLRRRLVRDGVLPRRCHRCGRTSWEGGPIPLELDHVDGDRRNNRLDNLRLLCPNCHALTPTYRGRNIGRHRGS